MAVTVQFHKICVAEALQNRLVNCNARNLAENLTKSTSVANVAERCRTVFGFCNGKRGAAFA
jgi:hypothetical protein